MGGLNIKALWEKAKATNDDINGGGIGRLRIKGDDKVFVGAFYLNMIMLFDGEQGYLKFGKDSRLYPSGDIKLMPEEFVKFIQK